MNPPTPDTISRALCAARLELETAVRKFSHFNSRHEAYGVLLEEVDELWDEIKHNAGPDRVRAEALQVAAMALELAAMEDS